MAERSRQRGAWAVVLLCLSLFCWLYPRQVLAAGQEKDEYNGWEDGVIEELLGRDLSGVEGFLQQEAGNTEITFTGLIQALMDGNGKEAGRMILSGLRGSLIDEISHGWRLAGELLALGLVGAVFANFSSIFTGSQISETAFFMVYLLAFTVLTTAFTDSMEIVGRVLARQTEFMRVLIPCYFPVAAWAGGSVSSAAWMEFLIFLIAVVQRLYLSILLPLTKVYMMLVMAGNLAQPDMLSKITGLLKSVIGWGRRSLVGLVLGFQLVQGMVLPYADSVQAAGVNKLLQAIPGVGDSAGAVTKMVLGVGTLVKNTMGAAAVVVLAVLSAVPLLKLAVLLFLYQSVAGVLQPVGDKRFTSCISEMAEGQKMLLGLAGSGLLLFAVTIALICVGTNGVYMGT
ncbi:MAG: sporulation protein [Lachnospiraceae bacterium]|jgi:stage III sporulation protein AE|nr:sporulation protein [Lachnospiraceae bacterium]